MKLSKKLGLWFKGEGRSVKWKSNVEFCHPDHQTPARWRKQESYKKALTIKASILRFHVPVEEKATEGDQEKMRQEQTGRAGGHSRLVPTCVFWGGSAWREGCAERSYLVPMHRFSTYNKL